MPLVEHVGIDEHRAPHGATARPERVGLTANGVTMTRFMALSLRTALAATAAFACAEAPNAAGQESAQGITDQQARIMKIRIDLGDTVVTATLDDNDTSRDFVSLLPLTLTLTDYADTEKISDLPKRLSTQGAPSGSDPSVGDLAYYAPWGNLALFYRDAPYASGLVRLGRIDGSADVLRRTGSLSAKIDVAGVEMPR